MCETLGPFTFSLPLALVRARAKLGPGVDVANFFLLVTDDAAK